MTHPNYAEKLVKHAEESNVKGINVIFQDMLLLSARSKPGMTSHLAMASKDGVCAALTVKFVEAAMLGKLSSFNQNSLVEVMPSIVASQFGSSFFALQSMGTKGNFELASSHLIPTSHPVKSPSKGFAFETALEVAITKVANAVGRTTAIGMHGDGGHVVGLKVVPQGTSSFFDANAGLYRFDSVDDLKAFCLGAYVYAGYEFTSFNVFSFGKMPPIQLG